MGTVSHRLQRAQLADVYAAELALILGESSSWIAGYTFDPCGFTFETTFATFGRGHAGKRLSSQAAASSGW